MLKLEIEQILNPVIESGKKISNKLTDNFWVKNYPITFNSIKEYNIINELNCKNTSEIIYCILNDITSKPKCKVCLTNTTNYKNYNSGYVKTCSKKCTNNDPDKIKQSLDKYKETCITKYGVDNISKLDSIKEQKENTMLSKYGVKYNSQRNIVRDTNSQRMSTINIRVNNDKRYKLLSSIKDIKIINLYNDHNRYLTDLLCLSCDNNFTVSQHFAQQRNKFNYTVCTECNPITKYFSNGEKELLNFIEEHYTGKIITNTRSIINPYEIDIYLPELNLAIEFNGVYWHSELHKDKNYHSIKSTLCKDQNIQLIHVWEDDWLYKQSIVKSILLNKFGKSNKIFARKCIIKYPTSVELNMFLDNNHIQGKCVSGINIGLYYDNELVSLITFGRRHNIFELLRFCNKLNTTVIGGASKLFKHFINNFEYDEIISYCNLDHGNGNLYKQLGFTYIKDTIPNYFWVINGIRSNRQNWQKIKLVKMNMILDNESEVECMHRHDYYRIYNSGSQVWKY